MPSALVPLANLTLSNSTTWNVTFSSISSSYRDLLLVVSNINSASTYTYLSIYLNNDQTFVYNTVTAAGSGSATSSGAFSNQPNMAIPTSADVPRTSAPANMIVNVMDYSATDKHKSTLVRYNVASGGLEMAAHRYASTSAITSLTVTTTTNAIPWASGGTFALYGVSA